jgi:hypothetical protein
MADITVPVPDERVPEFYQFFGAWLAGSTTAVAAEGHQPGSPEVEVEPWGQTGDDLALAQVVWGKLSQPAQAMFNLLMEHPGEKISGETVAAKVGIEKGKYGVAGLLAWPARHSYAVGRQLPVWYEDGPVGGSADYWIEPDVADLFKKAKH